MIVPASVMQKLMAMEQVLNDAARRRDESVQLVLATLGASPKSTISLLPDGAGKVIEPEEKQPDI